MAKVHHQVVIPNTPPLCCSADNELESSPLSTSYNEVGVLAMDSST